MAAAELMLNEPRSIVEASEAAADVLSIEERLAQVTSLSFGKDTLERALELLAEDLGVPIEIAGRDLQLEGITKNQSFGIDERDKSAREILLTVLQLANPDRTATGPADEKQKLVYVVREGASGERGVIVVTTRAAAKGRGEPLPVVFLPRND